MTTLQRQSALTPEAMALIGQSEFNKRWAAWEAKGAEADARSLRRWTRAGIAIVIALAAGLIVALSR